MSHHKPVEEPSECRATRTALKLEHNIAVFLNRYGKIRLNAKLICCGWRCVGLPNDESAARCSSQIRDLRVEPRSALQISQEIPLRSNGRLMNRTMEPKRDRVEFKRTCWNEASNFSVRINTVNTLTVFFFRLPPRTPTVVNYATWEFVVVFTESRGYGQD
jgi:hypothetical protein